MSDSILTSVKKLMGLPAEYDVFDTDIILHTNSVFSTLTQLGIGPDEGFMIEDATPTWDTFLGDDKRLNAVKTYLCLRVRMLFDPPNTAYLVAAMEEQIRELEWRLNVQRESAKPQTILVVPGGEIDGY